MQEDKKRLDAAILWKASPEGYEPDDVRRWLKEHQSTDAALAEAMAAVGKKVGWLNHELSDPDNDDALVTKYDKEFDVWWDLEKALVAEIIRRLDEQNRTAGTNYVVYGKGWHSVIEPFMEQNGYRDGAGWWIRK